MKGYMAYQRNAFTQSPRKQIHDIDYRLEPLHHIPITFSKAMEGICLLSKYSGDRFDRIAVFDPGGERM